MFQVFFDINKAWVQERETLTLFSEGIHPAQVEISLSDEWAGLSKIAVFRAGNAMLDVAVTGSTVTIPRNVLLVPDVHLLMGLYGISTANGRVVISTVWADLGIVQHSANPTAADNYAPPPLDLYAQVAAMASAATTGSYSGTMTFTINDSGKLVLTRTVGQNTDTTVIGDVTAYAAAKADGYPGTYADFQDMLIANYITAQQLQALSAAVEQAAADAAAAQADAEDAADVAEDAQTAATAAQTAAEAVGTKQKQHTTTQVELALGNSEWTINNVTGVTATNLILWGPVATGSDSTDSFMEAQEKQVRMIEQSASNGGTVKFKAEATTEKKIIMNLAIFD